MYGRALSIVAALAALGSATIARADAPTTTTSTRAATELRRASTSSAAIASAAPSEKRALPDYDGREPEPSTAGDALLWGPRVVLFPAWLVSEWVVRKPLEWLVVNAEKNQWPALIVDFFTFGPERTAGIVPTAIFDFGLRPSVGVYAFFDEVGADDNGLRLYAAYGGDQWYAARLADKVKLDEGKVTLSFAIGANRRPDRRFHGIGPDASDDLLARYRTDVLETEAALEALVGDAGSLRTWVGAHRTAFGEGTAFDDPELGRLIALGRIPAPPGYGRDYSLLDAGLFVAFDTRRARPASGSGVRLELEGRQSYDLEGVLRSPLFGYGGAIGGFVDLTDKNRVLSCFVSAHLLDPLSSKGYVPFTELLGVGGSGPMSGFVEGSLLGRSTFAARLEYRWPVWVFLDGSLHFAVGNVFGPQLEDLAAKKLRMSFGLGIRTVGRPDHAFNLVFALGTETFDRGAEITSVRFAIGTTRGF